MTLYFYHTHFLITFKDEPKSQPRTFEFLKKNLEFDVISSNF